MFENEKLYTCEICGERFIRGDITCCAIHAPGTCCHYGDTPVSELGRIKNIDTTRSATIEEVFGDFFKGIEGSSYEI